MLAGINRALTGRRRPARHANVLRAGASLAVVSWLAACATPPAANTATQGPPALTPQQEAADYLAHARARYLPPGPPSDPWGPYVVEASRRFDVPETWIREVMQVESAGYQFRATGELTVSPAGAMGLMQLMPETYDEMRGRYNLGPDAYEPHDNILAGSAYLREMYDAFGAPAFLAAYNAGPARLQDYLVHNKPLPDETRRYVWTIGNRIIGVWPQNRSPAEQLAVNHIPLDIPAGPRWVRHTTRLAARDRRRHEAAVRYAALHTHGRAHAHDTAPVEVAMAPEPGAARVAAVTPTPAVHRGGSLHLITPALAADHVKLGGNHWAVQVGAYANRQQAEHAAGAARGMVSHASPAVAAVHTGHATLYRARLGGLTHDGAVAACHRMSHCLVVSPASQ